MGIFPFSIRLDISLLLVHGTPLSHDETLHQVLKSSFGALLNRIPLKYMVVARPLIFGRVLPYGCLLRVGLIPFDLTLLIEPGLFVSDLDTFADLAPASVDLAA